MLKIYTDASTKGDPGPSGAGIILLGEGIYKQLHFPLPILTNHEAEFESVILALDYVNKLDLPRQTVFLFTDSKIVAQTIEKDYSKQEHFNTYLEKIHALTKNYELFLCKWIPESKNKGADHLARQGLNKARKELKNEKTS